PTRETIAVRPSRQSRERFVEMFGSVFEHSPWVAERAFDLELGPAHDTAVGVWNALCRAFRMATPDERLGVLRAHPDLAGKLAAAKRLTDDSTAEQASAGLDALTDDERRRFEDLNASYTEAFGFPFIIAVRDHSKAQILEAFVQRLDNTADQEFDGACRQVERIAFHRLQALLPSRAGQPGDTAP
ncbi:MAG: 2-oxo-4-hydroxy-4-carboxy-5-ureidoimidazoline decarboxylase, partial [Pseudomonadota bacterium]